MKVIIFILFSCFAAFVSCQEQPVCCTVATNGRNVISEADQFIRLTGSSSSMDFRWNWPNPPFDCGSDAFGPSWDQIKPPAFLKSSSGLDFSSYTEFCVEATFSIIPQCLDTTMSAFDGYNSKFTQIPFLFFGDKTGVGQYFKIDFASNDGTYSQSNGQRYYDGLPTVTFKTGSTINQTFPGWQSNVGSVSNQMDVTGFMRPNLNLFVSGPLYYGARPSHFTFCTSASTSFVVHTYADYNNATAEVFHTFPSSFGSVSDIINDQGINTLYIGGDPLTENSFLGTIDELRIWDQMRSLEDIHTYRYSTFDSTALPEHLVHYWKFDNNLNDEINTNKADLQITTGATGSKIDYFSWSPGLTPDYVLDDGTQYFQFQTPLRDQYYSVPLSGSLSILFQTSKPEVEVSISASVADSSLTNLGNSQWKLDYSATKRSLCSLSSEVVSLVGEVTAVTQKSYRYLHIAIQSESITVSDVTYPNIDGVPSTGFDTTGGTLTISGSNFGPSGNFTQSESALITFGQLSTMANCGNPRISGGKILCEVPSGVGAAADNSLVITLCGHSSNPIHFGYNPPTVTPNSITVGTTSIFVVGKNFGNVLSAIVAKIGNDKQGFSTATVLSANHTSLEIAIPNDLDSTSVRSFYLNLIVGGQQISSYAPISPTDTITSFSSAKSSIIPTIVGAVVGGVLLIIIIILVILVIIYRRRKAQNTAPFTDVRKKDFSPIIFGTQNTATSEDKKKAGNVKSLEELLVNDDLKLAFVISEITQITEADAIAKALVIIFEGHDKTLHLLKRFIKVEVETTESAGTLFRSNSMVSKMFKFYSRLIGLPYLYTTVGQQLNQLIWEGKGLEVDPERMEEGEDLDEMRWTLMVVSQKILKAILSSVDKCPVQFRILCKELQTAVSARFPPDTVNKTIGGFIFLRFFCPAVTSPESYGIVEEQPSSESRRLLILMTKVLQNLSNNVEFGSKELYMTKMNDFIQSNREKLNTFFSKLITVSDTASNPSPAEIPKGVKEDSLILIGKHLQENLAKITDAELKKKLQEILGSDE